MKFIFDRTTQTTSPVDMAILCLLAQKTDLHKLLEVGVYRGGFIRTFLMNVKKSYAVGVDPYPNDCGAKNDLLINIKKYDLTNSFVLYDNLNQVNNHKFDIIHIDGEHSESAVYSDINYCVKLIHSNSILILDDIWHPKFPGVSSAFFKFFHDSNLCCFLITRHKIYLCDSLKFDEYVNVILSICESYAISVLPQVNHFRSGVQYGQSTQIKGQYPVIIVESKPNIKFLLKLGFYRNFVSRIGSYFVPPIFLILNIRIRAFLNRNSFSK